MKRFVVFLVLFISVFTLSATEKKEKDFTSKKLGISLAVPKDWEIDESKTDPFISLYSPETKQHPAKTLDLERGLKMELSEMDEKDFRVLMGNLKAEKYAVLANANNKEYITVYSEKDTSGGASIICLHALVVKGDKGIWAVGYIPEKDKLDEYAEKYVLIITSIEQTKSDSK
jgi:hypothetical protein